MTLQMWSQLVECCRLLEEDRSIRAAVVRGSGGWAMSAGADIREFPTHRCTPQTAGAYNATVSLALEAVHALSVPTVAMIEGYAVGGGCEIAAACDIRIAADSSRIGLPLTRIGVMQGAAEAAMVKRLIGPGRLAWMVLSGQLLNTSQAYAIGLVDEVVTESALTVRTAELIGTILRGSDAANRAAKVMAQREFPTEPVEHFLAVYGGAELPERVDAFLAKRLP